jgi:hypothetical protein
MGMKRVAWQKDCKWTKTVLTGRKLSQEFVVDMEQWCNSEAAGEGEYMYYVVSYRNYVVVKIENEDSAMMFKLRNM